MEKIIEVKKIAKKYRIGTNGSYLSFRDSLAGFLTRKKDKGEFWALKGISFEVGVGEVVGIIGRNGAGKSTLLKLLSQITPPTKGEINLFGRVASLLEVGTGFHPELSGRENIYLNGAILGMSRREVSQKFDEIVDFAEIEKFLDTPVKHYSSGMYMRLAFAVAAHLEPEILVVDEVLAVGDIEFQKKCLAKMDNVAKSGRTVLFVSHNMGAIRALCSRVIVLDKGQIVFNGKVEEGIEFYTKKSEEQTANIQDRKDRGGNGLVKISNFEIKNQENNLVLKSFDKFVISIRIKAKSKFNYLELKIAFIDISGRTLFRVDSEKISSKLIMNNKIVIRTDEINIAPTLCTVNIGIFADGELTDYIKDVTTFNLIGNSKKNVRLYEMDMATILVGHKLI